MPGVNKGFRKRSKEQVIAALKKWNGKIYLAAQELGITGQTIRNYFSKWPEIEDTIREAKGKSLDVAEGMLDAAIRDREPWAVCFYLKTQGKDRGYVERQEHRVGGDENAPPIRMDLVDNLLKSTRGINLLAAMAEEMASIAITHPIKMIENGNGKPE